MTLLSREITTHSLFYIYDQLENVENNSENAENIGNNENNGNTQLEKFQRCDFGSFLETPTVYAIAYSILCDYVHDKKGIEAVHLVLNLILILIKRNHNYSDVSNENESISAKNLNQLVSKMPYYFNTFLILKIQFLDYPEFSLLDLISKTTLKLTIFEQLSKQEFPLSLYYFDEKGNNMNNNTSSNIESKNQIITSLKDKIKKEFNDRNHLFITNSSNFELLQDEELNEVCQICELGGENETLCYSTYLYQTNLPSKFELDGPRKEMVFQFSLCDHLVHLNCIFPNSGQVENEFRCPIDRFQKNLIIPKVDSFIEPTDNMRFAIENFLILFAQPFDVLLKSFTGIIILNEVRARFSSIEVKYSNQRLLARTLFYILWHAVKIFEMEIDESTLQYKTSIFQRFVYSLITQNVLTVDLFISLVKKSSCSLKSKEKCLFLRRCRILEHFVFDAKSETEVFESVRNSILKPINLYSYYGISENDLLEENCNKVVVSDDEILDEHEFANQNQNSNQNQQIDIPIQPDDVENQNQNDNHTQNCTILENLTGDFQFNTDFFRNNFPDDFLMICQKISMQNQSRIASFDMTTSKMVQKGTRSILELMIECEDDPIPRLAFIFGKENTMTYIQYRKNFMPLNSIYVDSDGEPDEGLKRERPVFFSQENYETAVDALLSGDFAQNLITIYQ
ncbi:hypothetical protein TRFO_05147 [Tritrichomonas foetus]|uniref:E3 ubiquitin-protein ligase n=1 Tax=Tritrichomonas foetus TaxID=1144522 RepID=A0A1J4K801_9EUKA|nr:hypothetical protein TRFO_05147 [Tritrichomonas foetus]|eukprot:OHT07527.1 hypothetical protein TRFO_05147 [Tritrichomonas foetus]